MTTGAPTPPRREVWKDHRARVLLPGIADALMTLVARGRTDAEMAAHFAVSVSTIVKMRLAAGISRKRDKMEVTCIKFPSSLMDDLRAEAVRDGVTLSDVVRARCGRSAMRGA